MGNMGRANVLLRLVLLAWQTLRSCSVSTRGAIEQKVCKNDQACFLKAGVAVRWDPRSHMADWWLKNFRIWEVSTFCVFRKYVNHTSIVLDLGGWIGTTSIWLATRASKVVTLEPSPRAFGALRQNILVNSDCRMKISALHAGFGNSSGFRWITDRGDSEDTLGPLLDARARDCGSSSLDKASRSSLVVVKTIDDLLVEHPFLSDTSFLKVDIEGGERYAIPAIRSFMMHSRPITFVSIHPEYLSWHVVVSTLRHLVSFCPQVHLVEFPWGGRHCRQVMLRLVTDVRKVTKRPNSFDVLCTWNQAQLAEWSVT